MKRIAIVLTLCLALALLALPALAAQEGASAPQYQGQADPAVAIAQAKAQATSNMWRYISAAVAVGTACIGGGLAVGQIGAAAMGAMSENPELSGKAIPYAGLAEGICLWGFLVALFLILLG
jgi:V/A-type H+-transporting ATPase subunit K